MTFMTPWCPYNSSPKFNQLLDLTWLTAIKERTCVINLQHWLSRQWLIASALREFSWSIIILEQLTINYYRITRFIKNELLSIFKIEKLCESYRMLGKSSLSFLFEDNMLQIRLLSLLFRKYH